MCEENLLKADGFDEAVLGVGYKKGNEPSLVYDYEKCIEILMDRDGCDYEEAQEFMDFNQLLGIFLCGIDLKMCANRSAADISEGA